MILSKKLNISSNFLIIIFITSVFLPLKIYDFDLIKAINDFICIIIVKTYF